MADIEQLKLKRISVLNQIHQLGVHLARLHLQDNKLYIEGACGSEATKNRIWDQVKLVDPSYSDLILHLTIDPSLASMGTDLHRGGRRFAFEDRKALLRQCERIYKNL